MLYGRRNVCQTQRYISEEGLDSTVRELARLRQSVNEATDHLNICVMVFMVVFKIIKDEIHIYSALSKCYRNNYA